jgi:uroporphyrinogen-III synthase
MRLLSDAGLQKAAQGIIAIALSPRIAAALAALPWAEIRTASRPDHAALLACLGPADVLKTPE